MYLTVSSARAREHVINVQLQTAPRESRTLEAQISLVVFTPKHLSFSLMPNYSATR